MVILVNEGSSLNLKIILDELNFFNSYWVFYGGIVEITNCQTAQLVLELNTLSNAIIQNCTFGNWTFRKVQNAFIKNCNNVLYEGVLTSLNFYNSSALIENMLIEDGNFTRDIDGILIYNFSVVYVQQSKFANNTVKHGIIKTLKSSSLIISNCILLGNSATEYPGVIYANESFVYLKNTCFHSNTAGIGGAIFITNMSFLQIKNCIFKKNQVLDIFGGGGAIVSLNNSVLDLSYSIFDHNKAGIGGAICQITSEMILNQCTFLGNSESAIAGLGNSKIFIINSIFQNNSAKCQGGAMVVEKSTLNVSNTTFENNAQISCFSKKCVSTCYHKRRRRSNLLSEVYWKYFYFKVLQ